MTDTVNVPREWLEEIAGCLGATNKNDWSELEPNDAMRGSHCVRVGALMELRAMLAAAPKAEPVGLDPSVYRLLQLADCALSNVTTFEADARYIMGNTNYAITDNARSEIRQFLLANHKGPQS